MKEEPNIGLYFRIISKEIKQLIDSSLNNDLTNIQIAILCYIDRNKNKEIYQKDIENFLKIRRSTTTEILNTMERKYLITRTENIKDKRKKIITISITGQQYVETLGKITTEINNNLLNGITFKEQESLKKTLEQIRKNIKKLQEEIW